MPRGDCRTAGSAGPRTRRDRPAGEHPPDRQVGQPGEVSRADRGARLDLDAHDLTGGPLDDRVDFPLALAIVPEGERLRRPRCLTLQLRGHERLEEGAREAIVVAHAVGPRADPRERIGHPGDATQVRRPRQQELPRGAITIQARLDGQQEVRRALHLVDHGAPPERRDKPLGVGSRCGANRVVVEREVVGRHPAAGEHLRERALAGLPRAEERHGARALHGVRDDVGHAALDQLRRQCADTCQLGEP